MAVLGPGIGSLLAMNILLVSHLQMSWDRRRDIIAVNGAYAEEVESAIKGENNPAVIKINAASNMGISDIVAFVQRPEVQGNLLEWIQYLDNQFQMATGLDDIHYGISQKQARVTSDVTARQNAANVRPDKMATDVHKFVVRTSTKELWLSAMYMRGQQLRNLLGDWGGMAWDTLFGSMDFVALTKEVEAWVEATDLRRPNREKDMADLERLAPFWLPYLQEYGKMSGNSEPANAFVARFAKAMEMRNVEDLFAGEWTPPADPAMQQMQQQLQDIELAKTQAETDEIKAKTVARLVDAQYKQQGAAPAAAQKLQWNELFNQQKLMLQEQAHLQNMIHLQEQETIKAEAARKKAVSGGK
jgi:hypothetical protein